MISRISRARPRSEGITSDMLVAATVADMLATFRAGSNVGVIAGVERNLNAACDVSKISATISRYEQHKGPQ